MIRRLPPLLSAVSFVLCVAACVLWVRSHLYYDRAVGQPFADLFRVSSANGTLLFQWGDDWPSRAGFTYFNRQARAGYDPADEIGSVLGLACKRGVEYVEINEARPEAGLTAVSFIYVAIPYWLIVAILGTLPVLHVHRAFRQDRRRRLARAGLCATCGYDLRSTPIRCPECGTVPAAASRLFEMIGLAEDGADAAGRDSPAHPRDRATR